MLKREIKFKAQSEENNNWIYGDLINDFDNCYIGQDILDETGNPIYVKFLILEETICEYIGLKDKNGTNLYEGDKCKNYFAKEYGIVSEGVVEYLEGRFILRYDEKMYTEFMFLKSNELEVIGNIYDKKEQEASEEE